ARRRRDRRGPLATPDRSGPARQAAQGGEAGMTAVPAGPAGRRSTRNWSWKAWLPYLGIGAIVIYCLAPFYWMVISALRRPTDQFERRFVPSHWSLENFKAVFKPGVGFERNLLNSVVVAGTTTILALVVGTFAAYALARLEFRGKNLALAVII